MNRSTREGYEPIAIVGAACRLPGNVASLDDYWSLLRNGRDAVTEISSERFATEHWWHPRPGTPGRSYTWAAGVVSDVDQFDPEFFGISPREATQMDPQHRLLLELAWEALELSGQKPSSISGSNCGVYVGISATDYTQLSFDDPASGNAYSMSGNTLSTSANRISHFLNLHGPSMAIDTACSSSLVALHLACESLWNGECDSVLAGGMHLLLSPLPFVGFSAARMLSPNGRSRAFDASADGYARGEGGGMVYLKPLSKARSDGDQVLATILATGTNSVGHGPAISVPSESSQASLLRDIYANAGISPDELSYVEAHGTGTAVGDPIEASAIGQALGMARANDAPLPIGSVKTNIGHLEPASGIAGLLKVVLCLRHRALPPSLHFDEPNPAIDFEKLNVRVVESFTKLIDGTRPHVMGVSSFGFGGVNAHIVLSQAPVDEAASAAPASSAPLILSAHNAESLRANAARYADRLSDGHTSLYDVAWSAASRRDRQAERLVVDAANVAETVNALREFASGKRNSSVIEGRAVAPAKVAFVFTGNGSQWTGMGRALLDQSSAFAESVERVGRSFARHSDLSLTDALVSSEMHLTEIAQPALFAVQVGLHDMLSDMGLSPDVVLGHSVGEVAAAYAGGIFTLDQAVDVIYARSTTQAKTRGAGRMAALGLGPEPGFKFIRSISPELEIAAVNSHRSVTVAGPETDLEKLSKRASEMDVRCTLLALDYAFHSKAMDPVEAPLLEMLRDLSPTTGSTPFISTVTGRELDGEQMGAHYWWRNVREPVAFGAGVLEAMEQDVRLFVEIGPRPNMAGYLNEILRHAEQRGAHIATLNPSGSGVRAVREAAFKVITLGGDLELDELFPVSGQRARLPTYAWCRKRYWRAMTSESHGLLTRAPTHPILGIAGTDREGVWEVDVDEELFPWLGDHRINGMVVFPGSAFIELALAASAATSGRNRHRLQRFAIRAPLVLAPGDTRTVRVTIDPDDGRLLIRSRQRLSDDPWTLHAQTRVLEPRSQVVPRGRASASSVGVEATSVTSEAHYARTTAIGLDYGPTFQTVKRLEAGLERIDSRLEAVADWSAPHLHESFILAPPLLDGAFQTLVHGGERAAENRQGAFVPVSVEQVDLHQSGTAVARCELTVTGFTPRTIVTDITLSAPTGEPVAELIGCRFHAFGRADQVSGELPMYRFEWQATDNANDGIRADQLSVEHLIRLARKALTSESGDAERQRFHFEVLPLLDALDAGFALRVVRALLNTGDETINVDELQERHGLDGFGRETLDHLVAWLTKADLLENTEAGLTPTASPEFDDVGEIWRLAATHHPEHVAELAVAAQVGQSLEYNVGLNGSGEGRQVRGPSAAVGRLLPGLRNTRIAHEAGETLLASIIESWPKDRRLRVMDCGGAAGWFGSRFAQRSGPNVSWTLSAPDPAYRERMHKLSGEQGVECLEGGPLEWGHSSSFDLAIVGCQALDSEERDELISAAGRQLVPGGVLIVCTQWAQSLPTIVWAAEAARLDVETPRRLHSADAWIASCEDAGFENTQSVDEIDGSRGAQLVIAVRPMSDETDDDSEPLGLANTVEEMANLANTRIVIAASASREPRSIATAMRKALDGAGAASVDLIKPGGELPNHKLHHGELRVVSANTELTQPDTVVIHISDNPSEPSLESGTDGCGEVRRVLALQQAVLEASNEGRAAFFVVSPEQAHAPKTGALAALVRVMRNEHPELPARLISYDSAMALDKTVQGVLKEILSGSADPEVLLKTDARFTRALRTHQISDVTHHAGQGTDLCLNPPLGGGLRALHWERCTTAAPRSGEVVVAAKAVGLNFRDVMFAMGLLPEEILEGGLAGPTLGLECAGEVVAVGHGVEGLEVGDHVVCFAARCFATRVVARADACFRMPADWDASAAATVTTTFFTGLYALEHLARLEPGERVLIHGASGGVGMAAIQIARHMGAEVLATAGSEEKRAVLELLGARQVFDSRSLDFASDVLAATDGEGVDVVLNCIAGEALRRGLDILRPFGRFLELGKRDFVEDTRVGLRPFRHNITYFGIDADQVLLERPALAARLLKRLQTLFSEGELSPLPYREFAAHDVAEAFAYMQQSAHLGKIVVRLDDLHARAKNFNANVNQSFGIREDATYLVSGGTRGFGLASAEWLFGHGARHIVLVGRNGLTRDEERSKVEAMRQKGAHVTVMAADVGDREAVQDLFVKLREQHPALRGIIHAAAVIDDAMLANATEDQIARVMSAKATSAWLLHEETRNSQLDFFVLYSSATAALGSPGQGAYVAANGYLQGLVDHRRRLGLPALAVGWNAIEDTGYLARRPDVREQLVSRMGSSALETKSALVALERLLVARSDAAVVGQINWARIARGLPLLSTAMFKSLNTQRAGAEDESGQAVRARICELPLEQAHSYVQQIVARALGQVLHTSAEDMDLEVSVLELGLDSLMGVELGAVLEDELQVELPLLMLSEGASIKRISAELTRRVRSGAQGDAQENAPQLSPASSEGQRLINQHENEFSSEEIADLEQAVADSPQTRTLIP